ncbi:conserved hypothetical protein [Theileria orientalis strain Shintoku]|uniref:Condensin complex subunit 2 n=1 Tax=Theileria orientalis strain Shintoku TaxID=869250 RepID=J4CDN9_THEOR|nr:conserved hypothetical protein [Theileria orientalis strain Shintoku]BAM41472.1 conserved hypothetical protein [Theileria orientalis strain Shintoku]|eukprot:XP_009691773.1 conserved hypothetical protein [Theileria orientalis strain Shintoku]
MKDGIRLTAKRKTLVELNENSPTRKRSKRVSDGMNEENEQKNRLTKASGVTNVGGNKGMGVASGSSGGNTEDSSKREEEKVDKTKLLSLFTDCMTALSSNKICSWNAFDIGIIDHMDDLVTLKNEQVEEEDIGEIKRKVNGKQNRINAIKITIDVDVCFSTASKVVEGASKVYGYRVEAVYDKTFNVLMNIQTTEKEQKKQRTGKKKIYEFTGGNTLSPESEVTLSELPVEAILMDPFFLKISSLFDQSGPQGLLLVNLLVNNNLQLSLSSTASTVESEELRDKSGGISGTGNSGISGSGGSSSQGLTANDLTLAISGCSSSRDATNRISSIGRGYNDGEDDNSYDSINYNGGNTKLNRSLLSQIVGGYSDMEILPELSKYMRKLSPEMLPRHLQEELTDLPAELIPNLTQEKLAISDQGQHALEDDPAVDIQLEEGESMHPYSQDMESNEDALDVLQQTQESTTGLKSLTIGGVGGTGLGLSGSGASASERGLKNRTAKVKAEKVTIEKYIYTRNLNEELDSIELLAHYVAATKTTNAGLNGDPSRGTSALGGSGTVLESSMDQLTHQLSHLNSIRHSVLGSRRTSIGGDLGDMDPVGDGFDYEMSQQMDEQSNFVDVLKLKTYILEDGGSTDVRFNGLVDYIYRRVNKNVISIHILFVCLLHVCNESNLRLEPLDQGKDGRTPRTGREGGDALVIVPNTQELSNSSANNDFRIKFDSFNP